MLARKSLSFEKDLPTVTTNSMTEGAITTRGTQVTETSVINMVGSRIRFKIIAEGNFIMGVQQPNYLSALFDEGLQYRIVNAHRSAISAYHDFINGKPIGKHPNICALLTGIFNERPP